MSDTNNGNSPRDLPREDLANALQAATLLIDRLRVTEQQQLRDCDAAREALDRAVTVVRPPRRG